MSASGAPTTLVFRAVDADHWTDFAALFESRGGPRSCWCMIARASAGEARHKDGASRRKQMRARIAAGAPVGILGYIGGEPVAWCSIAPRETYRNLGDFAEGADERIWSLVCLFLKRAYRSQGYAAQLIAAAVEHARSAGASHVEAYPVDPDSPSFRYGGFVATYARLGFRDVGMLGLRRHAMRLAI